MARGPLSLRDPVHEEQSLHPNHDDLSVPGDQLELGKIVPRFHLKTDGGRLCQRRELNIHHALYNTTSRGRPLEDLSTEYCAREFEARQPTLNEWVSHARSEEMAL